MKYIYLDTETSGFKPGQIGQLSMIIVDETSIYARNYFFDIEYLTDGAAKACGRTLEFYKQASQGKHFSDYAIEIKEILDNSTIIAHNVRFDENFLIEEFRRLGMKPDIKDSIDTMYYFKDIIQIPGRGGYKNPKLEEVGESYKVDKSKVSDYNKKIFNIADDNISGLHDSRYDTTLMFVCYNISKESETQNTIWKGTFCNG